MFNSNLKIYNFLCFITAGFTVITSFLMGIDFIYNTLISKLIFIISFLILIIFTIFTDKYFKKCYQLKKNAKVINKK